jgi:aminodeoxyfutalosine deaminase
MKGIIPMHTGLVEFVKQIILKREAPYPETSSEEHFESLLDFKHAAMDKAVDELLRGGTVAVGDICNTADSLELKRNSPLQWHNFVEVSGFVDAVAEKRFNAADAVLRSFIKNNPDVPATLVPHSPYSVSQSLFKLLNAETAGQLISIHNQETAAENELYQTKSGQFLELYERLGINIDAFIAPGITSMQGWLPYFTNGQKIICVHNSFTCREDLLFMRNLAGNVQLYFSLCINANLYIENTLPPVDLLMQNNCSIILGTDSYAGNTHLNMLEEIKSIRRHFPHIELATILQWATLNGALALGIETKFGSFEKGKTPGVVLISNDLSSSVLIP